MCKKQKNTGLRRRKAKGARRAVDEAKELKDWERSRTIEATYLMTKSVNIWVIDIYRTATTTAVGTKMTRTPNQTITSQ